MKADQKEMTVTKVAWTTVTTLQWHSGFRSGQALLSRAYMELQVPTEMTTDGVWNAVPTVSMVSLTCWLPMPDLLRIVDVLKKVGYTDSVSKKPCIQK